MNIFFKILGIVILIISIISWIYAIIIIFDKDEGSKASTNKIKFIICAWGFLTLFGSCFMGVKDFCLTLLGRDTPDYISGYVSGYEDATDNKIPEYTQKDIDEIEKD